MDNFFRFLEILTRLIESVVELAKTRLFSNLSISNKLVKYIVIFVIFLISFLSAFYIYRLDHIDREVITFGYREDAKPISYKHDGPLKGYCSKLAKALPEKFSDKEIIGLWTKRKYVSVNFTLTKKQNIFSVSVNKIG